MMNITLDKLDVYQKMLQRLELADVLEMMVRSSGKSWTEVGRPVGWTEAVINRIRDRNDPDYWPSASKLEEFCVVTGSLLLADWLKARALARLSHQGVVPVPPGKITCPSLMVLVAPILRDSGDLTAEVAKSLETARLEAKEKRRITRKLLSMLGDGLKFLSRLNHGRNPRIRDQEVL